MIYAKFKYCFVQDVFVFLIGIKSIGFKHLKVSHKCKDVIYFP